MASALKYMIDEKGDKTSVLVPLKTWEKINIEYTGLQNKLKVLTGITEGLKEVNEARKSGKKLQTLKDFLRESNS
jgi:proteasome assembly chaperone (PAC2) family protein